ncbi:YihY/virulence factor BrkB family protein [Clavibacter michiganensis subsp. phaseoli]|uniref:YihY/virulence factor BrkB family protein n=1 Tax=Clavibacter phaseoli TaxID=1734031 RepID=UPI001FB541B4|nr:YihY/virulence factor BrkB family protein [Clavibacter phaseoli]MCJ1709955.1 YihY/virulence factor BrkB family protein [Clavibacter phaseoli]
MARRDMAGTIEDRPDEEDARKPDSPTEIEKPSWKYVLRKTMREFGSDQCTDIAASLTYYAVLSLFPALIAIISLLGVFGQGQSTVDAVTDVVQPLAPDAVTLLSPIIQGFVESPAAGFALVSGIVLAIWSASGYVGAFTRAMNRIYEIPEGRPFLKLKPMQLAVTVIGIVILLICALIIAISGPVTDAIGAALGLGPAVQIVWSIAKWPVLAFAIVLLIAILYYATPNAKQPKFRWMSMGAAIALVVLVVASVGFAFYVTNFSSYAKSYGALAGVVVFLLWLWIANLALLFGAEFDAELERGRQLQAGIAAEETLQLPPRDTAVSDKKAAAEREDVKRGRGIRERHEREERLGRGEGHDA